MSAAAAAAVKRLALGLVTDFEGTVKKLFYGILAAFCALLIMLFVPVIVVSSIPLVFLSGGEQSQTIEWQHEIISLYAENKVVDRELKRWVDDWVDDQKEAYEYCDKIFVDVNINIPWYELMAVDTVEVEQDFDRVSSSTILETAKKFLTLDTRVEKVEMSETYTDEDGNKHTRTWTEWHAYITVKTISLGEYIAESSFTAEQETLAYNYNWFLSGLDGGEYTDPELIRDVEFTRNGNANIVYYSQRDPLWANKRYGDSTIRAAGCGPTSLAMVVSSLTGRTVYPNEMALWAYQNGYKAAGGGSYHSLMSTGAASWGLRATQISSSNPQAIVSALENNRPVIAIMGPGAFTSSGHFIVLVGIENGRIMVNDPWSTANTEKTWDLSLILKQSKGTFWAY